MYSEGIGVARSAITARDLYRQAAEQGNRDAQYSLGVLYEEGAPGDGVPQDYEEAVKWYRKAAEQGDMFSRHLLAKMYYDGRGAPKDVVEAARWFLLAAEQGDPNSQTFTGLNYWGGLGLPRVKAHMWLNLAAANAWSSDMGKFAANSRDRLAKEMTQSQIAKAQKLAREWKPK
jgi:TPR repeat protein